MRAVLAPGLGEGLQLAVGRVAAELGEVGLDRPASRRGSGRAGPSLLSCDRARRRPCRGSARRRGGSGTDAPGRGRSNGEGADDGLLDGVVGQDALDQPGQGVGRARRRGRCGSSGRPRRRSPRSRRMARALSASGSVTPGLGRTWTTRRRARQRAAVGRRAGPRRSRRPGRPGRPRRRGGRRSAVERALDQEAAAGRDAPGAGEAQLGGLGGDPASLGSARPGAGSI